MPSYTITYKIADKDSNIIKEGVIISRNRRDEAEARQKFFDYMYNKYKNASLIIIESITTETKNSECTDIPQAFKDIFKW